MIEIPDPANPGQVIRHHAPLSFKELKSLKEAVSSYGPLAPFTSAIFESYATSNLTSGNWQQLWPSSTEWGRLFTLERRVPGAMCSVSQNKRKCRIPSEKCGDVNRDWTPC